MNIEEVLSPESEVLSAENWSRNRNMVTLLIQHSELRTQDFAR